jgi:hypothetical protein
LESPRSTCSSQLSTASVVVMRRAKSGHSDRGIGSEFVLERSITCAAQACHCSGVACLTLSVILSKEFRPQKLTRNTMKKKAAATAAPRPRTTRRISLRRSAVIGTGLRLTMQAQRPGPRGAPIATTTARRRAILFMRFAQLHSQFSGLGRCHALGLWPALYTTEPHSFRNLPDCSSRWSVRRRGHRFRVHNFTFGASS